MSDNDSEQIIENAFNEMSSSNDSNEESDIEKGKEDRVLLKNQYAKEKSRERIVKSLGQRFPLLVSLISIYGTINLSLNIAFGQSSGCSSNEAVIRWAMFAVWILLAFFIGIMKYNDETNIENIAGMLINRDITEDTVNQIVKLLQKVSMEIEDDKDKRCLSLENQRKVKLFMHIFIAILMMLELNTKPLSCFTSLGGAQLIQHLVIILMMAVLAWFILELDKIHFKKFYDDFFCQQGS